MRVLCDAPVPWQIIFQDPATPWMEGIIYFHHHIFLFICIICTFVAYMMTRILFIGTEWSKGHKHSNLLEVVWTLTPTLILLSIAIPSFTLLYATDEPIEPSVTVKAIGHQWYWSYEYSDYQKEDGSNGLSFDSYMVPESELKPGDLRLLEVDNPLVLPSQTHINLVVSAADVLHCWSVPSFGIKIDAIPGRLNQVSLFIKRDGVFYGQCSELCGANHGFMPIVVKAVPLGEYVSWVGNTLEENA